MDYAEAQLMSRRTPPKRPATILPFPTATAQSQPQRGHWQDGGGPDFALSGEARKQEPPRRREPPAVVYTEEERVARFIRPARDDQRFYPQLTLTRQRPE